MKGDPGHLGTRIISGRTLGDIRPTSSAEAITFTYPDAGRPSLIISGGRPTSTRKAGSIQVLVGAFQELSTFRRSWAFPERRIWPRSASLS